MRHPAPLRILIFIGLLGSLPLQAQTWSLAYAGNNAWNPGLQIGAELPMQGNDRWTWSATLGGFRDPGAFTGTYGMLGANYHRITRRNWQQEAGVSPLGMFRSWLPDTYVVNDQGDIRLRQGAGRWYYAPSAHVRLGRPTKNEHLSWYAGLRGFLLMPYNTAVMPLLMVEVGVKWSGNREQ